MQPNYSYTWESVVGHNIKTGEKATTALAEACFADAAKYSRLIDWKDNAESLYKMARRYSLVDYCTEHMPIEDPHRPTRETYAEWLAENKPEYSVVGPIKGNADKITHRHNLCGYKWKTSPASMKGASEGCPKCSKTPTDADVIYAWRVTGAPEGVPEAPEGRILVKFGVTSQRAKYDRIQACAANNKMEHDIIFKQDTGFGHAADLERWMLSFGDRVDMVGIDGATEFRFVSEDDIAHIREMISA